MWCAGSTGKPAAEAHVIALGQPSTVRKDRRTAVRLMPIFRLAAVWLETTILTASVRAGAASLEQEAEAAVQTLTRGLSPLWHRRFFEAHDG
jgi:hypothetical protein